MNWTVITATNNEQVLQSCLLASPELKDMAAVVRQTGFASAAAAYNSAIERATTDVVILTHQDVYLPAGWADKVQKALDYLADKDPNWAVLGLWGVDASGAGVGDLYCTGAMEIHGGAFKGTKEVRSLDELLLIVRKSSGVRFDEKLGFHMYGTDICLEARRRGLKCHVISAFCIHNTNSYKMFPVAFWRSYLYIRRKWRAELPVTTPCIKITFWCRPMVKKIIRQWLNTYLKRLKKGERVSDPGQLYRDRFSATSPARPVQTGNERQAAGI